MTVIVMSLINQFLLINFSTILLNYNLKAMMRVYNNSLAYEKQEKWIFVRSAIIRSVA